MFGLALAPPVLPPENGKANGRFTLAKPVPPNRNTLHKKLEDYGLER